MSTSGVTPAKLTLEERQAILERTVAKEASHGWRIQSQSSTQASLVKGKPTSHLLHLILTIITLGAWLIVWILLVIFGGQKTKVITVDDRGNASINR